MAGLGEVGFLVGAFGEGTEGGGGGFESGFGVDIADEGDFQEAFGEFGGEPGFEFGEGALLHVLDLGVTEAGVAAVHEADDAVGHDAFGGVLQLGVHGFEVFAELFLSFVAVAGGGEVGGEELELGEQVFWVGFAGEEEGFVTDDEVGAGGFVREEAAEGVDVVRLESAEGEGGLGEGDDAGEVFGSGEFAAAEADSDADGAFFEGGGFDADADAVFEGGLGDFDIGDGFLFADFACGAEIVVGEGGGCFFGGGFHWDFAAGFEGGEDLSGGIAIELQFATDEELDVLGVPVGLEGGVGVGGGDAGEFLGNASEIVGGVGEDFASGELADEAVGEIAGAAGGGLVGAEFELLFQGGGGFVEFGLGEAVLDGAAEFLFDEGEGFGPVFGLAGGGDAAGGEELQVVVGVGLGGEDGGVFLLGDFGEALVDDGVGEVADKAGFALGGGIGFGTDLAIDFDGEVDGFGLHFGVEFGDDAAAFFDDTEVGVGGVCGGGFSITEVGLDEFGDESGVREVADGDEAGALGGVPFGVEVDEALAGHLLYRVFDADGEAVGEDGFGEGELVAFDHGAVVDGVAGEFFAEDDAAFFIDFFGIEVHAVEVVAEELHGVDNEGLFDLGEFEFVDGFLEGGVGVGVGTEGHAEALEVFDHLAGGEVAGAVEGHVFEEVGHALLVVFFHEGADVHIEAEGGAARGFLIFEDDVADAVFEGTELGGGVCFEVGGVLGPGGGEGLGAGGGEEGEEEREAHVGRGLK